MGFDGPNTSSSGWYSGHAGAEGEGGNGYSRPTVARTLALNAAEMPTFHRVDSVHKALFTPSGQRFQPAIAAPSAAALRESMASSSAAAVDVSDGGAAGMPSGHIARHINPITWREIGPERSPTLTGQAVKARERDKAELGLHQRGLPPTSSSPTR